ncbi:AAA family ATPase [Phytoactinopolyspora alkaliphila]|uniref:AAA family ATPase n=1 Tax=Phytoactinopolyspora alkaliphila TaxID=1783498 RepID=A0A6N9YK56_9ACTN|nr:AAA family ATPase [Phytoactinopolyspora alkaliphila]
MAPALVGREHPAAVIRAEVQRTRTGHGGLLLVTGEPGVGKTALIAEMLRQAAADGSLVAGGACWDRQGAPGYWPWVQVIRALERQLDPQTWADATSAAGPGLTYLLGDFTEPPPMSDLDEAAFRLCDAVTTVLVTVARSHPLVIALEDLHWADVSSLRMLDFVVRHVLFHPVLLVGTYRDVEIEAPDHPLREYLRPLELKATTVTLTGLELLDVATLVEQVTGLQPEDDLVAEIHRRTGGNPLFVEQLARLWQIGSSLDVAPPGIKDAVDRHLSYLPKAIVSVLADAAMIGPEFHRKTLAAVAGLPAAEVHQRLQQAALARLVTQHDAGRFTFTHDLVREVLYSSLAPDERRRRHAAVVQAVKDRPLEGVAARLAHHGYQAVPDVPVGEVTDYLLQAAHEAACRLASEEAATHFRRALELLPDDDHRRPRIMLSVADQYRRALRFDDARHVYEEVGDLARRIGDDDLAAHADAGLAELTGLSAQEHNRRGENGDAGSTAVFRRDGAVWTLAYAGHTVHVPDAKGLHDLHALLSRPGADIPAVELVSRGGDDEIRVAHSLGGDPVLDETAKAHYRQRLGVLDQEIDRALSRHDDANAAELDRERSALLGELRRAAGLGGRDRRLGDEAERSRKTVTARIRDSLRRLDASHPELAGHLRTAVSTGTACRYQPPADIYWEL